ncbi:MULTISPECIES: TlpA disulfide reductase family protein [Butyricimonas]|uniref:TlpA disulfide reductase family protein n=1 Tax=Butyricimonas TaxID=574697 RepID=UPI000B392295|nr:MULTISPECIES: TlpA disulfide reductase family protein [Butyricimonas]OUN65105.1 hypothetical protein B5G13_10855 [Butyricimonas sp. An62]
MKTISLLIIMFAFFSCTGQTNKGWTLKGNLEDVKEGWVSISELNGDWIVVDSTRIQDGKFEFKAEKVNELKQYYLHFKDNDFKEIYVKNILPVFFEEGVVELTGNIEKNKFTLSGTPNNEALNDYNMVFHTIASSLYNLLYVDKSWQADTVHGPYVAQGKYLMLAEIMPKFRYLFAEKYRNLDFSLAIYDEICMMDPNLKPSKVDSLLSLVPVSLHSSPLYKKLKKTAEQMHALGEGAIAPGFQLPTPEGKQVSLSSFRGKYLLLVFWASWCAPCRGEIPHLKEIYEKYHADGLDILSVSVDNNRAAWEKALDESNMPWTQVSDLQGLKGEVPNLYNVQGVPALWLIDQEGKIMVNNLRGERLDAKLKEIFGHK